MNKQEYKKSIDSLKIQLFFETNKEKRDLLIRFINHGEKVLSINN